VVKHVLYVDDEAALCRAFERALRGPELRVVTTTSAPHAVELLAAERFDVVATDYRMPELNGLEILRVARERNPNARRLLVSGRIEGEVEEAELRDADVDHVLVKPWSLDELRRVVRRAAEFAEVARERAALAEKLAARDWQAAAAERCADGGLKVARALGAALGIGAEELALAARIIAVADAYDRLLAEGRSPEAAFAALAGPCFDRRVLDALAKLELGAGSQVVVGSGFQTT